jgi:hypothetical protein
MMAILLAAAISAQPSPPLEGMPARAYIAPPTPAMRAEQRAQAESNRIARAERDGELRRLLAVLAEADGRGACDLTNATVRADVLLAQADALRRHRRDLARDVPAGAASAVGAAAGTALTAAVFLIRNRKIAR